MKNTAILIGIVLSLTVMANAQVRNKVTAHIPFDFYVQDQKMEAGDYIVESASKQSAPYALGIVSTDGKHTGIVTAMPVDLARGSNLGNVNLVFNRYGDSYVLARIVNLQELTRFDLRRTKTEQNLARAFGKPKQEAVAINASK